MTADHLESVERAPAVMKPVTLLVFCLALTAFADDFKTLGGKEYKNVTVSRVEPDGIVIITSTGISKLYFTELPKEVQERFHYDAGAASAYAAQQASAYATQQAAAQAAEEKNKDVAAHQRARAAAEQPQGGNILALADRVRELQQQEDGLLVQIAKAEQVKKAANRVRKRSPNYSDPLELQLPVLKSHLDDVRRDKKEAKRQLEKAQRQ